MSLTVKVILILVVFVALAIFAISYIKSTMGKAQRGVLHVPQGRNIVDVVVCDDSSLKPYKFGQTLDTIVMPGIQTMTNGYTGLEQSGGGAIAYRDKPVGFPDPSSSFVMALEKLANSYPKVTVCAVVLSIDQDGKPIMQLKLPNTAWFKRALKAAEEQGKSRITER